MRTELNRFELREKERVEQDKTRSVKDKLRNKKVKDLQGEVVKQTHRVSALKLAQDRLQKSILLVNLRCCGSLLQKHTSGVVFHLLLIV